MYLSRMQLDVTKRATMRALAAPNLFHGAVESAFPGERRRNLWRIDELDGKKYLLLLSEEKPELSGAAEQFGAGNAEPAWETRTYAPLLERIENGGVWHFRLVANPTVSLADGQKSRRGKVNAHITTEYQAEWLLKRAEKHGFSLRPEDLLIRRSQWYSFCKGADRAHTVTLLAVTYEGTLTVTDRMLFRQTLTEGIGRAKAYGMGMLTVVR